MISRGGLFNFLFLLMSSTVSLLHAQTPSGKDLISLHQINTAEQINISDPIEGSLLYNPGDKKIYVYTGSNWVDIGGNSGGSNDLSFDSNNGKLSLSEPATADNEVDLSSYVRLAPIKEITSNYTLQASDTGKVLRVNSGTDVTLTFPSGLPLGFHISVYQYGSGTVSFTGSGATVHNRSNRFRTAGQHAGAGIVCTAINEFHLVGDLKK